jgi:hypothetical protein
MSTCPGKKIFFQHGLISTVCDHGQICGWKEIPAHQQANETIEY